MLYKVRIELEWKGGSYRFDRGVRAVSPRHALSKAVNVGTSIPAYVDRVGEGIPVRVAAEILPGEGGFSGG